MDELADLECLALPDDRLAPRCDPPVCSAFFDVGEPALSSSSLACLPFFDEDEEEDEDEDEGNDECDDDESELSKLDSLA